MVHFSHQLTDPAPKVLILLYHRVVPEVGWNVFATKISERTFRRQLEWIGRHYRVTTLEEAFHGATRVRGDVRAVLTFDDGYQDNYEVAWPILRRLGLPAAFFIATDYVGTDRPLWDWAVAGHLHRQPQVTEVRVDGQVLRQRSRERRDTFIWRVIDGLKSAPRATLDQVLKGFSCEGARPAEPFERCMRWDQLQALQRAGMEIGAHSGSHRSLCRLAVEDTGDEIARSKATLERALGRPCRSFALPFGSARDYTAATLEAVQAAGFARCLLNVHGYNHVEPAPFALKRIIMTEETPLRWLLG